MAEQKKLVRILSLDGGGIRGLLVAQILEILEAKLNTRYEKKFKKKPERPIRLAQYFDMIAGTSTGGILTCALLMPGKDDPEYPRYSATDCVNIYLKNGKQIFTKSYSGRWPGFLSGLTGSKFVGENIETTLKKYFGDTMLSHLLRPCLITSYDIEKRKAVFFCQHDAVERGELYDFPVREVTRCTSAAPTFFPPAFAQSEAKLVYHSIDGGLFANNPTMCVLIESLKYFGKKRGSALLNPAETVVVSIGTGTIDKSYKYKKAKGWGLIGWVQPIIDIMMSSVSETVDYQIKKLYDAMGVHTQYLRISPDLMNASPDLDDVSDDNLEALRQAGIANALKYDDKLDAIVDMLLENEVEQVA